VSSDKYTGSAADWSREQYADSATYLRRRADVIARGLTPGDVVLDLACGDGGLARFVVAHDLEYRGVDLNEAMVLEARRHGVVADVGDLNGYLPREPVAATTLFRALYYARDRAAFFRHVGTYTEQRLVLDLNPRQYALRDVERDLVAAGFLHVEARPFFVPQRVALPAPVARLARFAEDVRPLARAILRVRFTYVLVGSRSAPS
jgi:SAM-dependent methyltransferase